MKGRRGATPTSSPVTLVHRNAETLPAPKVRPHDELEVLLSAEAEAAKRADVEVLLALQAEKARLVEDLLKDPPGPEVCKDLAARAGANLPLLRQLVALHRGLLGGDAPLYGPRGLQPTQPRNTRLAESR